MTALSGKVRLISPKATKEQWLNKNPILKNGEVGYEVVYNDNNEVAFHSQKVGDGVTAWADLPYVKDEVVQNDLYATEDVFGLTKDVNLKNLSALDIIKLIVNKYNNVSLTTLTSKVGSSTPKTTNYVALGRTLTDTNIYYTIGNSGNLLVGNNAKIIRPSVADIIYNTIGISSYQLDGSLVFNNPTDYSIVLEITGLKNEKVTRTTTLAWRPEIYYKSSSSEQLATSDQVKASSLTKIDNTKNGNYNFSGAGYSFLCIPTYFPISGIVFKDPVTNLTYPMDFQDMLVQGAPRQVLVTNANGATFTCNVFRSVYLLSNASTLAVS